MVKIFGRVENFNLESSEVNEDCVTDCFEANDCFLGFMDSDNHCLLFNFNDTEQLTVSETGPEDKLVVAFKTFNVTSPSMKTVEDTRKSCNDLGGYKLIGVASYEELLWIKQKHDAAKYVGYAGYWVDGKREEVSSGMINTNFEFSDGLTVLNKTLYDEYAVISGLGQNRRTPEDCLTVCQPGGDRLMNDVMCDTSGSGYGFVCGYQLV
uniref:CW domain-containing protein n=1 Tax=Caenorhabditis tropicalis TaxID=1561998 RepID=A0A1I7UIL3_9PELO